MGRLLLFLLLSDLISVASATPAVEHPRYRRDALEFSSEREDSILSGIISEFMADSKMQLVIDMDLFWSIFANSPGKLHTALQFGDESYLKGLLEYVEKLKEYDVSAGCLADIGHFLWSAVEYARWLSNVSCKNCSCNLRTPEEHQWIFNVIDAFGKVPAGVLGGNNLWIGSWSACRRINVVKNRQGQKWSGQYCMARFQPYDRDNPLKNIGLSVDPDPAEQCNVCGLNGELDPELCSPSAAATNVTAEDDDKCFDLIPLLNYGICTPASCTNYDVKKMIDFVYKSAEALIGREMVCNVDISCTNNLPESQLSHDLGALLVLFFVLFIIILMLFGTLYDYIVYQKDIEGKDAKAFYTQQNWFIKTLLSFSVYTNGKSILRTERRDKQIHCLHGLRVLSMFWIILGHSYYYMVSSLTLDNLLPSLIAFPQQFFNLIIVQAPLAVDTFFYLSGMLTCYLFMEKFTVQHKRGKSVFAVDMWSLFCIHRYVRLTPIYIVVMLLDITLFTYFADGPFWRPIEKTYCRESWWTNLIYLNNFLKQDTAGCMGWTWYLANDMQFHLLAPILLILLFKKNELGVALCGALIVVSSIVHLGIVEVYDFPPAPLLTAKLQIVKDLETYWPNVYIKPYIRCIPYLMGLLVGFLLHKITLKPALPRWPMALGWAMSTCLGLVSVFGLFNYARTGEISEVARVAYVLFGRSGYAVSLAWVTFACATGYGGPVNTLLSWRAWIPLSRITFCAYLIHPPLIQIYNLSRPHPFHFTAAYQMIYLFAVAVVIAYFVGFFLSLAFEIPVSILENLIVDYIMDKLRSGKRNSKQLADGNLIGANCGNSLLTEDLLRKPLCEPDASNSADLDNRNSEKQ